MLHSRAETIPCFDDIGQPKGSSEKPSTQRKRYRSKEEMIAAEPDKFKKANLSDDYLFSLVMRNREVCALVLSIILDKTIVSVEKIEIQKSILNSYNYKSVRLDVCVTDENGIVYDIEMQVLSCDYLPKRSRFYQGMLDLSSLHKGKDVKYKDLPDSFVIFITEFDVFGHGLYKYTFRNTCDEVTGLELGDGATKIFLNTQGMYENGEPERLINFLHFVHESTVAKAACDSKLMELYRLVSLLKNNKELEDEYMNMGWVAAEAEERVRREGIIAVISAITELGLTLDVGVQKAASKFDISPQEAKRIYLDSLEH